MYHKSQIYRTHININRIRITRIMSLTDFGSANICSCTDVDGIERNDFIEPGSSGVRLLLAGRGSGNTKPSSACDFGERFLEIQS